MKTRISFNGRHTLIFLIFTFYLLFSPPILGRHSMYAVAAFSWVYILVYYKTFFRKISIHKVLILYLAVLLLFIWTLVLIFVNDGTKSVMIHYIYWIIAVFPACICLSIHIKKYNGDLISLLNLIIGAAFIQSLISILAFTNEDIKLKLISLLEADGTISMASYKNEIYYRLFGFSGGLTFDMPVSMAMIACIAIYLAINYNIRYMFFVPTIVFSAVINARTSAVVLGIGVVLLILMRGNFSLKSILRLLATVILVFLGVSIGSKILSQISPMTYNWFRSGMSQIAGYFNKQTDSGYFGYLLDEDRWILPKGISLLFGTGSRIMGGGKYGVFSDVGYINDLWFGGVAYSLLLYGMVAISLIFAFVLACNHPHTKLVQFIIMVYAVTLPILNIKTYIISYGIFTTILILICVFVFTGKRNSSASGGNCFHGLLDFGYYSRLQCRKILKEMR